MIKVFDLAPRSLSAGIHVRASRLLRVLVEAFRFTGTALSNRGATVYIGVSGGYGQVYDCLFVLISRLFGCNIVLHHHSFAYIRQRSFVCGLLLAMAGRNSLNIVLCDAMAKGINGTYKRKGRLIVLSNVFTVGVQEGAVSRQCFGTAGFLGNIAYDKGILEFLDLAGRFAGSGVAFTIAGPFQDGAVERDVMARLAELPGVRYLGPVYGAAKSEFFASIDVLLFPTKYRNEAEPLTILEAMSNGVPVIARGLGCIPSMLSTRCGGAVEEHADFAEFAERQMRQWQGDPLLFQQASMQALLRFREMHASNVESYAEFLDRMAAGQWNVILSTALPVSWY